MVFNSLPFLLFFLVVFSIYWSINNKFLKIQNICLLVCSYFFYGYADWSFLLLLAGSSMFNYTIAHFISLSQNAFLRKLLFLTGIGANISSLIIFKYFNFFIGSIQNLFSQIFGSLQPGSLELIVPLGISFYTFLSISYIVDVYKKKIPAEKNIVNVLLSLSFFPIILAGPIQRPSTLIPQLREKRIFNLELASDGIRQFLWGLFVKMVIADNCAVYTDKIFSSFADFNPSTLLFGALLYSIQIYADFSAYSDMAIGIAKLLGFQLIRNFNFPYFARDISDFWKRWHISLTLWFRDYVFLPIAYWVSGKIKRESVLFIPTEFYIYTIGILITWSLTGLWHGANHTFIVWGLIHALFLVLFHVLKKPRKKLFRRYKLQHDNLFGFIERLSLLIIVSVAWVFFRSESIADAYAYLNKIWTIQLFMSPDYFPTELIFPITLYFFIEWFQREHQHGLDFSESNKPRIVRWAVYYSLIILIFFYQVNPQEFIYFNF